MADAAIHAPGAGAPGARPNLEGGLDPRAGLIFLLLPAGAVLFVAYSLYDDVSATGAKTTTFLPYVLLFVALLIALGFEFVNGFHDSANAVATVIYTHSLPVSTTHILSSGVAGTMAANGSGLQLSTIRNIVLAWVLTLPMAMMLSGALYLLFLNIF
jgi:hypothetical protein